jgi:hypothetical protein
MATPPPSNSLAFEPPTNFSSGGIQPSSVALADINGDGKLDIVVSNFMSYTVAVFVNKGDGTFGDPILTAVQITPEGLGAFAVGDFNEDGKLDLVVDAMAGSDTAIVLLGNGDGTFTQLPPIPNSFGFIHSIVVDLNGDGHLDLANACNGNIELYLGNGDGTFQSPRYLPYGPAFPGPFLGITMGDFNGDKKNDIVGSISGATQSPQAPYCFTRETAMARFKLLLRPSRSPSLVQAPSLAAISTGMASWIC